MSQKSQRWQVSLDNFLSHNSYEMVSNKPSSYQVILNKVHPDLFLLIFDHFKQQYNLRTKLRWQNCPIISVTGIWTHNIRLTNTDGPPLVPHSPWRWRRRCRFRKRWGWCSCPEVERTLHRTSQRCATSARTRRASRSEDFGWRNAWEWKY